jgi:hypothetical protein
VGFVRVSAQTGIIFLNSVIKLTAETVKCGVLFEVLAEFLSTIWMSFGFLFFFFSVPVCAITASRVPGGTLVSMKRFSILCG